ncbi:metallophosphoesterase [Microbacterium sp. VKM Ac-2870]|uniref:metallophosphoesterase n=1 Tax=Microbacterium sp. VKM Ac-2870 TaxID=2783825 RepID=UPI001E59D774|nr:metallophosphoesterase [Microbacterium sp. VKM Ac-2870]
MPLRLLHLSDIHFHASSPGWDEDSDLRAELIRDLRSLVAGSGPIDAVLVGGDIAFSAKEEEYAIALEWIDGVLVAAGGIERSQVWTVPGNHDVDRAIIASSKDVQDFRREMADCDAVGGIDAVFRKRIAEDPTADGLMMPLAEYNRFAEKFLCTTQPNSLAWQDNSLTVDGWTVRLTGINSVMNSGPGDDHQTLVVGTQQCRLPRADDTIHVAMLHHPPHWIRDWESIEPYLNRAHLVLFGHEHAFEAEQLVAGSTVRVSAGAVAPERDGHGEIEPYVPTYNVLTLSRDGAQLQVDIHPRYWSKHATRFDEHPHGARTYLVDVDPALPTAVVAPADAELGGQDEVSAASPLISPIGETRVPERPQSPETRRSLRGIGVDFLGLPMFRRLDIARALGVVDDEETRMPPRELYPLILERVRERGLIENLISEMER